MRKKKVVDKDLTGSKGGVDLAGGIHAVISASVNEKGATTTSSVKSRRRIVQRNGETVIDEHEIEDKS